MFNFPSSPIIDQVYGSYTWNGYAWIPQSGGIPEAPMDGNTYGRQNGEWVLVTAGPAVEIPINAGAPNITVVGGGGVEVGTVLSCTTGTWDNDPTSYAYQWKREGVNIDGATDALYTLVIADTAASITCEVTAINAGGASAPSASVLLVVNGVAVNPDPPLVTGLGEVGRILLCSTGTWTFSPTSYSYQWKRDGVNIDGATADNYLLVSADGGTSITCAVTATNPQGVSPPAVSNALEIAEEIITLGIPELQWESSPLVNPPLLTVGIPDDTLAGDHIIIEISYDSGETWTGYLDVAVDDPDGEEQAETAGLVEQGDSMFRAFMQRGVNLSDPSTEVNVTIDTTVPVFVSSVPANGDIDVLLGAVITLEFNKAVYPGPALLVELYDETDTLVEAFTGADLGSSLFVNSNYLAINPTANLEPSMGYYVLADVDAVLDGLGQGWVGISDPTDLTFTTTSSTALVVDRQFVFASRITGAFINSTGDRQWMTAVGYFVDIPEDAEPEPAEERQFAVASHINGIFINSSGERQWMTPAGYSSEG